eukprot:CAMPEP_0114581204 /NCGR_PEP_ID=MMETSP0125-20121206/5351_1 /TAXON_ID=485358 ORGANISM="Aristerostoma sp., Strain ATCC 50986" /NCGR_SAMPLE_ID=MMETSP0125 /ASSEMBLY_ACC=CAM_ASM_000245 /LENGTH=58 /DNA_ID=CAMNT_0001773255 /DNA_START=349 /DNA_END=524 /DNA_ORIENTATION=-
MMLRDFSDDLGSEFGDDEFTKINDHFKALSPNKDQDETGNHNDDTESKDNDSEFFEEL